MSNNREAIDSNFVRKVRAHKRKTGEFPQVGFHLVLTSEAEPKVVAGFFDLCDDDEYTDLWWKFTTRWSQQDVEEFKHLEEDSSERNTYICAVVTNVAPLTIDPARVVAFGIEDEDERTKAIEAIKASPIGLFMLESLPETGPIESVTEHAERMAGSVTPHNIKGVMTKKELEAAEKAAADPDAVADQPTDPGELEDSLKPQRRVQNRKRVAVPKVDGDAKAVEAKPAAKAAVGRKRVARKAPVKAPAEG